MAQKGDRDFFERRLREELVAAAIAVSKEVRATHLEMAYFYAIQLEALGRPEAAERRNLSAQ